MTQKVIDQFIDEYAFLSNFYQCVVTYRGITYSSSEAAFQAQKTLDITEQVKFTLLTPSEAKKFGRTVKLRKDWESVKYQIMYDIVLTKFVQNEHLKKLLLETGDADLVEGNWWNDTYWGRCKGVGKNNLGKILTGVRSYLRSIQYAMYLLHDTRESL